MTQELEEFLKKQTIRIYGQAMLEGIQQKFDDAFHPRERTLRALEDIGKEEEAKQKPASS